MEHCKEYIELISAAIDGALTTEETARLEEHLNACPDCQALYDDLNRVHQALLELPPVEVPEGLTERILEAVAADNITALPKPKKSALRWKKTVAAAAVFALILLGAGTLRGRLNATKSVVPESFMAELQNNEMEELDPGMAPRSSEGVANEENQALAQGYQGNDTAADGVADATAPTSERFTVQGSAKQSPASSSEVQTAGAQAPEPRPTEPPSESETGLEVSTFTIGDITDLPEGDADPEATLDLTVSLFVLPTDMESPEGLDNTIAAERAPGEPGESPSLTREESLALVVERCFGDSGYEMVREDLDGEPLSCHVSLMDGDAFLLGGTIVCAGETEEFFLFECHWDDDPENPYHYSVHKTEGYVSWAGDVIGQGP